MRRPYLIVCGDYDPTSVGNVALLDLCHRLNKKGETAYITAKIGKEGWKTPSITDEEVSKRTDWIVVYPDAVLGNPCGATRVVRWLMNKPEFYWKTMKWDFWRMPANGEFLYTYHKSYYPKAPELFLKVWEKDIFYKGNEKRKGYLYYLGKAVNRNVKVPKFLKEKGVEIKTGKDLFPKTKKELADMLRRAERLYLFIGSALGEEAILCGCPVVYLGNPEVDAIDNTNWNGIARDDSKEELERAISTMDLRVRQIRQKIVEGDRQVDEFIKDTQREIDFSKIKKGCLPYTGGTRYLLHIPFTSRGKALSINVTDYTGSELQDLIILLNSINMTPTP